MTKVVVGMSMSLDGIAGPESADADSMAVFTAILGWQFPLRSWGEQQARKAGKTRWTPGSGLPTLTGSARR
jgi:hypothetical protein